MYADISFEDMKKGLEGLYGDRGNVDSYRLLDSKHRQKRPPPNNP